MFRDAFRKFAGDFAAVDYIPSGTNSPGPELACNASLV
jgi:hypothetical protein